MAALVKEQGDIKPYVDLVLRSLRHHYIAFCRRVFSAGLCQSKNRCQETVGIFFV